VSAGVAETHVMHEGKDEFSLSLLAGPGFSKFSLSDEARVAYRQHRVPLRAAGRRRSHADE
jgi:hypothetical protein